MARHQLSTYLLTLLKLLFAKNRPKSPKKYVGDKIRCCRPPACLPSPVHRSDPPRAPGNSADPTTHRPARVIRTPSNCFSGGSAFGLAALPSLLLQPSVVQTDGWTPQSKNAPPIFFAKKSSKMPQKYVGYKIWQCHPPECLLSPVHRSDPLRPLVDHGDPHDTPVRSRYATPPNFLRAARPSASPRPTPISAPSVV
jgi:hypothetical protein